MKRNQAPASDLVLSPPSEDAAFNLVKPAVSVVMPVRNGERYIEEAVRSIQTQTLSTIELIVVDDGSTDGTRSILQSLAASDPRIRIARNPGSGLVAALNHALSLSRAPIIARMDADDIALPDRLRRQLAEFEGRPKLVLLGAQMLRIDKAGRQTGEGRYPTGVRACREHLEFSSPFAHPTVMFRAEAIRSVGGYRDAYRHAEDYDLWLRLCEVGEIDNLQEFVLKYRVHDSNVTSVHAREQAARTALAIIAGRARSQNMPEPRAPSNAADLTDVLDACKGRQDFQELAIFAYWRTMLLNRGLSDPAYLAGFHEALPQLSTIARRAKAGPQFAFMMIRAAHFFAERGSKRLAAECLFRSFAVAPLSTILQPLSRLRLRAYSKIRTF